MNLVEVANDNGEKEYTVTIPLERYTELVQVQRDLDNLINFIFNTAEYDSYSEGLNIDEDKLGIYLRNVWSYTYTRTLNKLKEK